MSAPLRIGTSGGFPRPHRRGRIETNEVRYLYAAVVSFPRPHRRGRIETRIIMRWAITSSGFPRPHRRGRIETSISLLSMTWE